MPVNNDAIMASATITVYMSDRSVMNELGDLIQKFLTERMPNRIKLNQHWTIKQEYVVMDLRAPLDDKAIAHE